MKKALFIFALLSFGLNSKAQQIFGEIGRVSTQFVYANSEGESIDNLYPSHNFSYLVGYRLILSSKFNLNGGLLYNRYGMTGSDPLYNNAYKWDAQYLGLSVAMDYDFLKKKKFIFFARAAIEPQFLVKGTQSLNRNTFDLKGVEQFDKPFIFLRGSLGVNYCLDQKVALTGRYSFGRGNPFGQGEDPESLKLNTSTISIGIIASFKNCDYCVKKHFN